MKRLTIITRSLLFIAFPLLVLNCGGTAVDEDHGEMMEDHETLLEDDHDEMMEHDGVMDEAMPRDSVDHVIDEEEMIGEEGL